MLGCINEGDDWFHRPTISHSIYSHTREHAPYVRARHTSKSRAAPKTLYSLEFQFLLDAVPSEKWGCIRNHPFIHFAVTIEVRSGPVAVIQVCRPAHTGHEKSYRRMREREHNTEAQFGRIKINYATQDKPTLPSPYSSTRPPSPLFRRPRSHPPIFKTIIPFASYNTALSPLTANYDTSMTFEPLSL